MRQQRHLWHLFAVAALVAGVCFPAAGATSADPRVADIVRAGALRATVFGNPVLARKDAATGEWRGVTVDLARELAARIGVPLQLVEYANPTQVQQALQDGAWDVTFLAIDPSRALVMDFSPPYMEVDNTYMVPANSSIRSVADADQPGIRIAVGRANAADLFLSGVLKHATLVRADTEAAAFELLRTGQADAFASNRTAMLGFAPQLPGARILEDRFNVVLHAMAVPKGQADRLDYVLEFIEQAKASGFVQQAFERHDVRGVQVAPPAAETEVRALFERFIVSQNSHDLTALADQLLDSPRFLWLASGTPVRGREAALQQFGTLFQGTWQWVPQREELQVTSPQASVAHLYVPLTLTTGAAGETAQTSRFVMSQTLVKTETGWRIASLVLAPAP